MAVSWEVTTLVTYDVVGISICSVWVVVVVTLSVSVSVRVVPEVTVLVEVISLLVVWVTAVVMTDVIVWGGKVMVTVDVAELTMVEVAVVV